MLGPIFSFELLTASRRVRYFVVRGLYGVVLAAALCLVWMSVFWEPYSLNQENAIALSANFMAGFFATFSVMQLLAAVGLGPAIAAGTIASERERRTIEYLFTANLCNAEIVLSKLAARFLQIMIIILAGLPVLAVAMLQGGIAPEALAAVYVVTFSTVITVAAMSIAVSVWSSRARDAVIRAYLVLLMLLIVPAVVAGMMASGSLNPSWRDVVLDYFIYPLTTANPFWMLSSIISGTSGATMSSGWDAVGALVRNQMIFAVLCAAYATLAVRRVHVGQMGKSKARRRWRIVPHWRPGLGRDPMLWKELFAAAASSRLGALGRIAICLLAACVLIPMGWQFYETITKPSSGGFFNAIESYLMTTAASGSAVACGIAILVAARAACSITSEKERDCWQSLIGTPLSGSQIVRAKVLGSIYAFRVLFGVLFLLWGMALVVDPGFIVAVPFMLFTLLVVTAAVASLGVLLSLRMKSSLWAMAATLGIGIFAGGGYMFCCMPFLMISGGGDEAAIVLAPCIPFLMFVPGLFYAEPQAFREGAIVAANVFGVIGYTVTAAVLYGSAIACFETLSGRTDSTPSSAYVRPGTFSAEPSSPFMPGGNVEVIENVAIVENENTV